MVDLWWRKHSRYTGTYVCMYNSNLNTIIPPSTELLAIKAFGHCNSATGAGDVGKITFAYSIQVWLTQKPVIPLPSMTKGCEMFTGNAEKSGGMRYTWCVSLLKGYPTNSSKGTAVKHCRRQSTTAPHRTDILMGTDWLWLDAVLVSDL